jgi:hypothetical protein
MPGNPTKIIGHDKKSHITLTYELKRIVPKKSLSTRGKNIYDLWLYPKMIQVTAD